MTFSGSPFDNLEDEETFLICLECNSDEEVQLVGEDSLSYCSGCESIEGSTEYMTEAEIEVRRNLS